MTSTARRYIVAGPSREALFDALRLQYEGRKITFTVAPTLEQQATGGNYGRPNNLALQVKVDMLRPEDGSGNNWLFELIDEHQSLGSCKLRGHINTTLRCEGWVEPIVG